MLGGSEILLILAAAFLLFGPNKMPEIGRSLGKALRELQKVRNEFLHGLDDDDDSSIYTRYDRPRRP
jgi:TatA/E family protein of Tat protein translocase